MSSSWTMTEKQYYNTKISFKSYRLFKSMRHDNLLCELQSDMIKSEINHVKRKEKMQKYLNRKINDILELE